MFPKVQLMNELKNKQTGRLFQWLEQTKLSEDSYPTNYQSKHGFVDAINNRFTHHFFRTTSNVQTKNELDRFLLELTNLTKSKQNFIILKQLLKINSQEKQTLRTSLAVRFSAMIEKRLKNLHIQGSYPDAKEIGVLSHVIARTILLAAKRQQTDYLYLLKSMIDSYIDLKTKKVEAYSP